jgi:hypothetical protein
VSADWSTHADNVQKVFRIGCAISDTPSAPGDARTWERTDIAARTKPTIGQNDRSSSREPSTTT